MTHSWGVNPATHEVRAKNFYCVWRTHYLAEFLTGKWAFQFFFPFIPDGYPSICAEYHTKRNENYFFANAGHQNALRPRCYPIDHTLAKAKSGLFQGECLTWMAIAHSNL
jgi:hypothetical protein